jgi:YebC/PmpR family DNA-binding regulatory protein
MSGHNKWSKIKNKKASEDAKKSKVFSIHVRLITIESKKAGGDKNSPGLRAAIERARADNMPADNIERAIAKGIGATAESFEEVLYEAYGPAGVALLIEGVTDNKNRTVAEVKHILNQNGGSLGAQGSAVWAFEKKAGDWVASLPMEIAAADQEALERLVSTLEDNDDIKKVFTNAKL